MFHLRFGLSDHLKALLDFVFGSRRRVKKVRIFRAWFSHMSGTGVGACGAASRVAGWPGSTFHRQILNLWSTKTCLRFVLSLVRCASNNLTATVVSNAAIEKKKLSLVRCAVSCHVGHSSFDM